MKFTRYLLVFVPFLLVACANRAPLQSQSVEPMMQKEYYCKVHFCKRGQYRHCHVQRMKCWKNEPRIQMIRF